MEVSAYLHADKDAMWETGAKLGLTGDALRLFRHACTEVEVRLAVDSDGSARIIAVNGVYLTKSAPC